MTTVMIKRLAAERLPLSVPLLGRDHRIEVRRRANGFRRYDWLSARDFLIIGQTASVLPPNLAPEVAALAESAKKST